mgnify:CR=1 FL=1
MTPSITQQAAEVFARSYVNRHRTHDGRTLPCDLDELLAECRTRELFARVTRDQLMHALRWAGWGEVDGFWAVPGGAKDA